MGGPWQFEILRPLWFAALAILPLLFYARRRTLVRLPRRQQARSLAVRIALMVLVIVALAGPRLTVRSDRECVVMMVDDTASVSRAYRLPVDAFVAAINRSGMDSTDIPAAVVCPGGGKTDLAAAITRARADIPADRVGRIVLFSDGNQTEGDALAAARAAGASGVPISTVPLSGPEQEVYVSAVTAPAHVRRGEPFYVEVIVQSTHEDDGTIQILYGPEVVDSQRKHVVRGENRFRFAQVAAEGPAAIITAKIDGFKDTIWENNEASCAVLVDPPPRVLLVESQPVLGQHLAKTLGDENVEVEVRGPQDVPANPADLRCYELVILSNVPASSLPAERMKAIQGYVRNFGGGLIAVGGDQSMTAGGYHGTILEETLPVVCEPKGEKVKPGLAMVLVLDISGSMEGRSIDLAKQALRRAVEMLGPRDQVGVLVFEDRSQWITPLGPVVDKQKIVEQIGTIRAEGGTTMYPAIERAYLALRESFADMKHIIVMTDGVSNPGDFDALTKEIAAAGITMSTVGVGDEPARPLLEGIAKKAKGHAYFCDDAAAVPKIFEIETRLATRFGITEEPFFPQVVHSAEVLRGIDITKVPTLLGYVETQPKPGSQVILAAKTGEPLLASWRYGLGTVTAFTSDIQQSRWASAWLRWPGFGQFWAQLVRQTMRKDPLRTTLLHVEPAGGDLRVSLDAVDTEGRFINGAEGTATLVDPEQKSRQAPLRQVAPGRYAATLAARTPGAYFVETKLANPGQASPGGGLIDVERLGLVLPYPEEFRIRPPNTELLRAIAEQSGGRYDPQPDEVVAPLGKTVPRLIPLWPLLLVAALLVFLLDVALKRIAWKEPRPAGDSGESDQR